MSRLGKIHSHEVLKWLIIDDSHSGSTVQNMQAKARTAPQIIGELQLWPGMVVQYLSDVTSVVWPQAPSICWFLWLTPHLWSVWKALMTKKRVGVEGRRGGGKGENIQILCNPGFR